LIFTMSLTEKLTALGIDLEAVRKQTKSFIDTTPPPSKRTRIAHYSLIDKGQIDSVVALSNQGHPAEGIAEILGINRNRVDLIRRKEKKRLIVPIQGPRTLALMRPKIEEALKAGATIAELAEMCGCTKTGISHALGRWKITPNYAVPVPEYRRWGKRTGFIKQRRAAKASTNPKPI
jgi:hypothetical protein